MIKNNQDKYAGTELNSYAQIELMRYINPTAKRILDLGCGDAATTVRIGELCPNAKLYGLTYNKEEAEENKTKVEVVCGDAHNLPWEDGYFDVVFARHILEHCITPAVAIQEINRVLEMGGEAIICVPGTEKEWIVAWKDHYSVLPQALWEKLFVEFGFEITKKEDSVWTAYYSLSDEIEHRYCLKKIRNVGEKTNEKSVYKPQGHFFTKTEAPISVSPIAIAIHNFVVFETLCPLLKRFESAGIGFDILIPDVDYDENAQRMFNDTADSIKKNYGYSVLRVKEAPKKRYKIALYSFVPFYFDINAEYKVRYQYGIGKPTYNFDLWSLNFDYIMCMGKYDEKYLSAYTNTVLTGPLKYIDYDFNVGKKSDKRKILYLPTYGDMCEIEEVLPQLENIKHKYDVTIKFHHMTSYFESERVEFVKKYLKEEKIYYHTTPLLKLIREADIVICDGSGAFFDAIIACKPVILIKPDEIPSFESLTSIENELVRLNEVYSLNDTNKLEVVIEEVFGNIENVIKNMEDIRNKLFPICGNESAEISMNFINKLLIDDINYEYLAVHRKIASKFYEYEQMIRAKDTNFEQLNGSCSAQREKLLEIISEHKKRIEQLSGELNNYIGYDAQKSLTINQLTEEKNQLTEEKNQFIVENNKLSSSISEYKNSLEELTHENVNYVGIVDNKDKEIDNYKQQIHNSKISVKIKKMLGNKHN